MMKLLEPGKSNITQGRAVVFETALTSKRVYQLQHGDPFLVLELYSGPGDTQQLKVLTANGVVGYIELLQGGYR